MKSSCKKSILFMVITLALVFSALGVTPAFADDETPPPPATEEPVQPPTEEVSPPVGGTEGGSVPLQEPAATEAPVVAEEPAVTETPVEASTEETAGIAEVLEQLPDDTTVVVLDVSGDPLPLVTQAAANVLAVPDPQFCPGTLQINDPGCSPIRATIAAAIADAYAVGGSGTIYVEPGTFTEDVTINGNLFTGGVPLNFALSGAGSSSTFLDGWLTISNMNSFTLSGFTIKDIGTPNLEGTYVWAAENTGPMQITDVNVTNNVGTSPGIEVWDHDGDISLSHVTTNGNSGGGARLYNSDGTGNISVTSSQFNNNNRYGLLADSIGNISLLDVIASENDEFGASLGNSAGAGSITVISSQFNDNFNGLVALSRGDINLLDVIADENDMSGAHLDNWGNSVGSITVTASQFSNNGWKGYGYDYGVAAHSNSNINLLSVTANHNYGDGAELQSYVYGDITIASSEFSRNGGDGLDIYAEGDGDISLLDVIADENGSNGAILDNWLEGTGDITVTASRFNKNGFGSGWGFFSGLTARSKGDISLLEVTANDNFDSGADLHNWWKGSTGNILVRSSEFYRNGEDNANGLTVSSNDDIKVQCSRFKGNVAYDIYVLFLDSGTLTLDGNIFAGNTSGDIYLYRGTLVNNPDYDCNPATTSQNKNEKPVTGGALPLNIIYVTGGEQNTLSCTGFSGTEAVLPNGDRIILHCPNGDEASLASIIHSELPGALDGNFTFISGLDAGVSPGLIGNMIVKFIIPVDQQDADLTILHWDGTQWEELGGAKDANGFFRVDTQDTGIFVMVRR